MFKMRLAWIQPSSRSFGRVKCVDGIVFVRRRGINSTCCLFKNVEDGENKKGKKRNKDSTERLTQSNYKEVEWKDWIKEFKKEDIPFNKIPISFSRSSGPGGQNVNKVSTKVEIRLSLNSPSSKFIHPGVIKEIRRLNSSKINNKDELIISSDSYRTQIQNREDVQNKLYDLICSASYVPEETDETVLDRIDQHIRIQKDKLKKEKQFAKSKKQDRKIDRRDF